MEGGTPGPEGGRHAAGEGQDPGAGGGNVRCFRWPRGRRKAQGFRRQEITRAHGDGDGNRVRAPSGISGGSQHARGAPPSEPVSGPPATWTCLLDT